MEFRISPLRSVEEIEFGETPETVRRHFNSDPKKFNRTPQSSFPCDYFESEGVFFYYDTNRQLEAVEFASPAQPTIENLKLLGLGLDQATVALSRFDNEIKKNADGAISYRLGISVWAPLAKDDATAPIESIIAFRSGYYD